MLIKTIIQPERQLGDEISELLDAQTTYSRIIFVSAFVGLRTILRMRERLLTHATLGTRLILTIGIDLGGTSREVLEELLRWNCETYIFHNTIIRATFHPKVYLFQDARSATLFIGSNNLTDGGFYTNYEAATRYDFELPEDTPEYERLLGPLSLFFNPSGGTVQRLDAELIQTLIARGELPTEADARQSRRSQSQARVPSEAPIPDNPFRPIVTPRPPLLPQTLRIQEPAVSQVQHHGTTQRLTPTAHVHRALVWQKTLPQTDALQVNPGSHSVGGVRLTQARFEDPIGNRIDQTTYFRNLFAEYHWECETGGHRDQEHTFVLMRLIIRGRDYGDYNFEISHKPSGEAGQANYTTILRWGRELTHTIFQENLTGTVFSLYETPDEDIAFLIDITDP